MRSEHVLFSPIEFTLEQEKQALGALISTIDELKEYDKDELIARAAAGLSGLQIEQEDWESVIERAFLNDLDFAERYIENYENVVAAQGNLMDGLSCAQKQHFVHRLPPAKRAISKSPALLACLLF